MGETGFQLTWSSLIFFFFPYKSKSVLKFGLAEAVSSDKPLPNIASPVFHPSTQQNKAHTVWTGSEQAGVPLPLSPFPMYR